MASQTVVKCIISNPIHLRCSDGGCNWNSGQRSLKARPLTSGAQQDSQATLLKYPTSQALRIRWLSRQINLGNMRPLNACKPAIIFGTFWVSFGNLTKITTFVYKKKGKHGMRSRETANRKWKWSCSVVSDSLRPMDCSPQSSSVHGILQARILEWVANGKVDHKATFHLKYYSKVFGAEWKQHLNSGFKMTFNKYQKWSDKEEVHLS